MIEIKDGQIEVEGLDALIAALQILRTYRNPKYPTHCEHDALYICGIDPSEVSNDDKAKLRGLGFIVSAEFGDEQFLSFRSFPFRLCLIRLD